MRLLPLVLLLGLLVPPAEGQTIWSRPYEPNQVAVEVVVPEASDASVLSGATFLTGTVSLNDNLEIGAELPVARYGATADGVSSTTALGNPYLGLGLSSTTLPLLVQLGGRLPLASSNAASRLGQAADIGRLPAFQPDEFVLSTLINGRLSVGRNSSLRLRTGIDYASRPQGNGRERGWRMLYEAQLWRDGDRLLTGLTLAGRAVLSSPGGTQHHAAVSLMGNWRRVQPGLLTGVALNDLLLDGTVTPFVGLTLSVTYLR